jgi:hypothetical protein
MGPILTFSVTPSANSAITTGVKTSGGTSATRMQTWDDVHHKNVDYVVTAKHAMHSLINFNYCTKMTNTINIACY